MTDLRQAAQQALAALENCVGDSLLGGRQRQAAIPALKSALEQQAEPVPIYYMRDNHTFKELSADVSTALVEIESEFNAGYTYGSLCSKREGFPKVHASGYEHRLVFFWECKTVLEKWIYTPPQQQAEPVAWMDREGDLYKMPEIKNWAPPHVLLYTAPPQRQWVGLTDEDFLEACQIAERGNYLLALQRIQIKLKERNT